MSNPEYENKVNPTELYNDDILAQFEAIRNVIHKEILPSTYNELVVTSNQAGTLTSWMDFNTYPQTEIIFPLSPQSGNINWLEKNFLRFRFRFQDTNDGSTSFNFINCKTPRYWDSNSNSSYYDNQSQGYTAWGVIDGASIFKSVELNYAGTAIWTSAYQQVEAFMTYASLPDELTQSCNQYWTNYKTASCCTGTNYLEISSRGSITTELLVDIDISRLSPILSWLSIIPGFINKLTLRVIIDAPYNWLCRRYESFEKYENSNITSLPAIYTSVIYPMTGIFPLPSTPSIANWDMTLTKWCVDICEIHQNNATMTEDTRIRLIALIQQLGGKWIYPCRYWNTAIAPIQSFSTGSTTGNFQYVLTGCYFRALAFVCQIKLSNGAFQTSPGNYFFTFPIDISNIEIYCDSELIVQYNSVQYAITDTNSALMDNDKYAVTKDIIQSMYDMGIKAYPLTLFKDILMKATGPPNGMYSGKYTSEKMGTHNILLKMTWNTSSSSLAPTIYTWCSALQDGVIVFDNFNGSYFSTARKMQQVYEALT